MKNRRNITDWKSLGLKNKVELLLTWHALKVQSYERRGKKIKDDTTTEKHTMQVYMDQQLKKEKVCCLYRKKSVRLLTKFWNKVNKHHLKKKQKTEQNLSLF